MSTVTDKYVDRVAGRFTESFLERFVSASGATFGVFATLIASVGVVSYFAPQFWSANRLIYVREDRTPSVNTNRSVRQN